MLRCVKSTFLCLVLSFLSCKAHAEKRVALIIGNSAYTHAPALANPSNDATAMAGLLRSLNFDVVVGNDMNRTQMAKSIAEFSEKATDSDAAILFYAGHGIQLDGKNYLIPIDADLSSEMDVKMGSAVDADTAISGALSNAKVKIVLLDACRDNPFKEQLTRSMKKTRSAAVLPSGLAEMKSGAGTLLAYATSPGEVALDGDKKNSPFTTALLTHLGEPNVDIEMAMKKVRAEVGTLTDKKQSPWANTNLEGFFYMNQNGSVATTSETNGQSPASLVNSNAASETSEAEVEFWRSVKDAKTPDELRAYLTKYPSGNFAGIARNRIAALESGTPSSPPSAAGGSDVSQVDPRVKSAEATETTEKQLNLNAGQWQLVQLKLKSLGFFRDNANGKAAASSRLAISKWQAERSYITSGYLNQYQHAALLNEDPSLVSNQAQERGSRDSGSSDDGGSGRRRRGVSDATKAAIINGIIGRISDVRVKKDIELVGQTDKGLNLYRYRYIWDDQMYVGVMAQEVQAVRPEAVVEGPDGYLRVVYEKLGLKFQTWEEWKKGDTVDRKLY